MWVALLIAAGPCALAAGARADHPLVTQVLQRIARTGIRLIYSSQVVAPELRARHAVHGATALEQLRSLLGPLGLAARRVAGDTYVIVPAPERPAAPRPGRLPQPPLNQVVVQTSRYQTRISSSRSVRRVALENSPETHNDAVRALQVIPGTTAAGYTARTHVRGSRDDEVLYRYDGVTLHEPYHLKELQSLFSPVDPMAVDSVTAWTGLAPIKYGNAIGGVVSMRPRQITRRTVDLQLSEQGASAMAGTPFADGRGTVFADLRLQNQFAPVGWINSGVGTPTLNDLIVHVTWRANARTQIAAGALAIDDHRKYFGSESAQSKGVSGGEYYVWLRLDHRFSATLGSATVVSAEQSHENVSGTVADPNIVTGSLFEHSWHAVYTVRQELRAAPAAHWYWHLGAQMSWVQLVDISFGSAQFFAPFYPDLQPSRLALANETLAAHAITYALYGSVRWQATPRATVDLGVRRNARHYIGGPSDAQWNVRANLRYRLTTRTTARLGWGQQTQANVLDPHLENGRFDPPDVRRVTQTDFSLDHRFLGRSAARAELYYKDEGSASSYTAYLFSPFPLLPELAVDQLHISAQRSRMYGVELSFATDPSRALSATMSYAWSRAEDRIAGVWIPRAWDEPNAVKLNTLWRHTPFSVAASLTWHSGWPYTPLQVSATSWSNPAAVQLAFGRFDSARLQSFFTLDLRLSWQRRLGRGTLQTFLDIYDATDAASTCCYNYTVHRAESGQYMLTQTRAPWLLFTPILGVRWHF